MNWRQNRWIILGIIFVACLAYLPTLQPGISASPSLYLTDVGNNQNALSRWGALHGTAYPLYSFTGNVFVSLLGLIGVAPAVAAGLYSTFWAIAALIMLFVLINTWLNDKVVGIFVVGLLGLNWVFWLHSSIAEVYTLTSFIIICAVWLAIQAERTQRTAYLYGLAICCAMAVAHHRAIALAMAAPLLIALPAFIAAIRRRPIFLLQWFGVAALAAFGPYLYLLIRVLQHASWLYGDPTTPDGFWRVMFGEQYTNLIVWPNGLAAWLGFIRQIGTIWLEMTTWPVALLGLAGIIWLLVRRQYRYGLALLIGAVPSFLFAIADQTFYGADVPIEDVPSLLQTTVIFALLALAFLLSDLKTRSVWLRRGALVTCAAICFFMVVQNRPVVYNLTHDTTSRQIIDAAQQFLAEMGPAPAPAFFAPWGGEFWTLAYARDVSGDLRNVDLLPNRADLKQAVEKYGRIYTFKDTFYDHGLNWWRKRLGDVHLSSVDANTVAVSAQPILSENDLPGHNAKPIAMGESSIVLRDWAVKPLSEGKWQVTLYWQATAKPDRDYSVFVHASDRAVFDSPDAVVAQADANAPVLGWYSTSLWQPGEIVRDDHLIVAPPDRPVQFAAVGLYFQDEAGAFHNLGQQIIPLR